MSQLLLCGYNRYPDEKGTESLLHRHQSLPVKSLQPLPR